MSRKKSKYTKKQINILYECWKNAETNKERIELIKEKLPSVPPLVALNDMRFMAKTDSKWIDVVMRRKDQKKKEKLQIESRRKIREKKREERNKIIVKKSLIEEIKSDLKCSDKFLIEKRIKSKIFFCSEIQQFMNNISCIFRKYSEDYGLSVGISCEKCMRMDKYIPIIQEVIKDGKQKRIK